MRHLPSAQYPNSILVGAFIDFDLTGNTGNNVNKRTTIASKDIISISQDLDNSGYNNKAIMSWDGLFRPVSLTGGGGFPRVMQFSNTGIYSTASGEDNSDNLTNLYFNFLANPTGYGYSQLSLLHTGDQGHDIEMVARKSFNDFTGTGSGTSYSLVMPVNVESGNYYTDYSEDYRFFAMRGPMWMHGWGYDTDGKPVPNEADTVEAASSGIFTSENLTNRFLPNWLKRPNTWPVAPLDVRLNRERGVWEASAGSGAGGGSSQRLARVYDNLPGYTSVDGKVTPGTVRCLPEEWDGAGWLVNTDADFIEAYPAAGTSIDLDDSNCCATSYTQPGLRITNPIMGDNRVSNVDLSASGVVIYGYGIANNSSVSLSLTDGSSTISGTGITVNSDGTWQSSSIDITSLNYGSIKITAQEFDIGMDSFPPKNMSITYSDAANQTELEFAPPKPSAPDLLASSDTEISTDNITSETVPVFRITNSLNYSDATGPKANLYANGNLIGVSDVLTFSGGASSAEISGSSPLNSGIYTITYTLVIDDGDEYVSGHSDPLYIVIDPSTTGTTDDVQQYCRRCIISTIDDLSVITQIFGCPIALTSGEMSKLEG